MEDKLSQDSQLPKLSSFVPSTGAIRREDDELEHVAGITDQKSFLEIQAHPIMSVYCDELGIVCFKRHEAVPIYLGIGSPKYSRQAALRRVDAVFNALRARGAHIEVNFPISDTGVGLTYVQLQNQTLKACLRSRKIEAKREVAFQAKMDRYKVKRSGE